MSRRVTALVLAASLWACAGSSERKAPVSDQSAASEAPEPVAWAPQVGQPVLARRNLGDRRIEPAALGDSEYTTRELVTARRIVYRVNIAVPSALRTQKPIISPPAGELHIDLSEHRLRARFIGPGWPIDEGSEVRMRGDVPGVYLFDAEGGRPVPPGQLSNWFQGGTRGRVELILQDYNATPTEGHADLLCHFLAEWTHIPRDEVLRSCAGMLPPIFRFGVWTADLTAFVPLQLPREDLRADTHEPPAPIDRVRQRQLLDREELARIPPLPPRPGDAAVSGTGKLSVDNRMGARVVVVVQGIAIGFVDASTRAVFEGLTPGMYRVAAMRTSSSLSRAALTIAVPGELRAAGESDQLGEPLLSSPDAAR